MHIYPDDFDPNDRVSSDKKYRVPDAFNIVLENDDESKVVRSEFIRKERNYVYFYQCVFSYLIMY